MPGRPYGQRGTSAPPPASGYPGRQARRSSGGHHERQPHDRRPGLGRGEGRAEPALDPALDQRLLEELNTGRGELLQDVRTEIKLLARTLSAIPGVVEHGLFLGMCHLAIIGKPDGTVVRLDRNADMDADMLAHEGDVP